MKLTPGISAKSSLNRERLLTSQLLHHLNGSTENSLSQVGGWVPERARETSHPRSEVTTGRHELSLVFVVGDDLGEFLGNVVGVGGLTSNPSESSGSLIDSALLDEPTGRLG
jgi:hypothetical protein